MQKLSLHAEVLTERQFSTETLTGSLLASHSTSVQLEALSQRTKVVAVLTDNKETFEAFVDLKDLARSQKTVASKCNVCSTQLDDEKCRCENCKELVCLPWAGNNAGKNCCMMLEGLGSFFTDEAEIDWSKVEGLDPSVVYDSIGILCDSCLKATEKPDIRALGQQYKARLNLLTCLHADVLTARRPIDDGWGQASDNEEFDVRDNNEIFGLCDKALALKPATESVYDRYLKGMSESGSYANHVEISCAVIMFASPVVVPEF